MIQGWVANPENYPKNGGHKGWDFSCPVGTPDLASILAKVISATYRPLSGYGREIVLQSVDNPRVTIVYGHHSEYKCKVGDIVQAGQIIGLTGGDPNDNDPIDGYSLGPHLHFEPRMDNVPFDPALFFAMDFTETLSKPITNPISEYVTVVTNSVKVRRFPNTDVLEIGTVYRGAKLQKAGDPLPGTGIVKSWQPVVVYLGTGVFGDDDPYLE
jgi:hypothetical protein